MTVLPHALAPTAPDTASAPLAQTTLSLAGKHPHAILNPRLGLGAYLTATGVLPTIPAASVKLPQKDTAIRQAVTRDEVAPPRRHPRRGHRGWEHPGEVRQGGEVGESASVSAERLHAGRRPRR